MGNGNGTDDEVSLGGPAIDWCPNVQILVKIGHENMSKRETGGVAGRPAALKKSY